MSTGCRWSRPHRIGVLRGPQEHNHTPQLRHSGWGGTPSPHKAFSTCKTHRAPCSPGTAPQPPSPGPEEEVGTEAGSGLWSLSRGWPACCRQERGNLERFPLGMCQRIEERQLQQGMFWPDGNELPLLQPQSATGPSLGPTRVCPCSGAPESTRLPLVGPRVFLILQGCISWHSGQTSGDRGHTLGGHTFPNITHTHKIPTVPSPISKLLCILQYPA